MILHLDLAGSHVTPHERREDVDRVVTASGTLLIGETARRLGLATPRSVPVALGVSVDTPELAVRFKWRPNSIAFWDNRCTQHHALWDYYPHKRYGHRVTVCGQKPY